MKRYSYVLLVASVAALAMVSCKEKNKPSEPTEDYVITQFADQPFLGETYISDYDYNAANMFLVERYKAEATGGCSSFRNGDFIARNQDWYVKNFAMLVVHIAANEEKHRLASVNIVASNPFISREMIASGEVQQVVTKAGTTIDNWRDIFPIFTLDGINEKGLCASTNIVMHEDLVREGYKPCTGGEGRPNSEKTSFVSLTRYILDNCASCQAAIDSCAQLHVTQAFTGLLRFEDNHVMVSDQDETIVLEWYNDEMKVTRFPRSNGFRDKKGMPAIMTNFYNYVGVNHTDENGVINLEALLEEHPYAMGVERYELLREGWEQATTAESAKELISKVDYSKFYTKSANWYTENGSVCAKGGGKWYYPSKYPYTDEDYIPAESLMDAIHNMCEEENGCMAGLIADYGSLDQQMRNLDSGIEGETWYTEFTSIYDIPKKEIQIKPQEGWYANKFYSFSVFGNRK